MTTDLDISFQQGIDLLQNNHDLFYQNIINSYHTWDDDMFFHNKVILAHIVINEPDSKCEIISLLHRYNLTCSGYDILFKPQGEEWQIRNCKCPYPQLYEGLYCDKCQRTFKDDNESGNGNFYLSLEFVDEDELDTEPQTKDFCFPCVEENPELLEKYNLKKIKPESLHYFGFNVYSLLNFKSYLIWDINENTMSATKKPAPVVLKDYEHIKSLQDTYVELRLDKIQNEITEEYEDYTSQFGIKKLF